MQILWKLACSATRQLAHHHRLSNQYNKVNVLRIPYVPSNFRSDHRLLCSGNTNEGSSETENKTETSEASAAENEIAENAPLEEIEDIPTPVLLRELQKYYDTRGENLQTLTDMVMKRALAGNHEESDDEIMESLRLTPLEDVRDSEFESDFSDAYDTDNEIGPLIEAPGYVRKKYFQSQDEITAEEYDELLKELQKQGDVLDIQTLQNYVEQSTDYHHRFPEEIKKQLAEKCNELRVKCDNGEMDRWKASQIYKEYENQVVKEYTEKNPREVGHPSQITDNKFVSEDPPGSGPILRWETRVVLSHGGNAWHPANRKVKLSVFVKELGLSKYARKRLRELVGKRYNTGKDELTIVGERYAYREENRKDCLRTLYALIEEAQKADRMVEEAKITYTKDRLRATPGLLEKLKGRIASRESKGALSA